MRKLEFRTEAVLKAIGGISQFSTAFDAMADLVLILTRKEALEVGTELLKLFKGTEKEFIYFTLRGAGRGLRSHVLSSLDVD
jgi:hypothetical protein